jgi:hypothetical protein
VNHAAALVKVRGNMFTRRVGKIERLLFLHCRSEFMAQAEAKHGNFELNSSTHSSGPAILFEHVSGQSMPVLGNP